MASLPEGDLKAEITLSGGTGKTTIQSPADVHIENGVITAEIVWSSSNYDLMIVDGREYTPVSVDGGAKFVVEIPSLNEPLNIQARTVAMSTPHLIDYTITVSSEETAANESDTGSDNTSVDLSSLLESLQSKFESMSGTGEGKSVTLEVVSSGSSSGLPPIAIIAISAALGAAVAFVAVTIGKKKK